MHIFLVGLMGTGKSTLGRHIASYMERPFLDTDALIEKKEEATITSIFSKHGEPYFRECETRILQSIIHTPPSVVATGGGLIESPKNQVLLQEYGRTYWLYTPINILYDRLKTDTSRPLLKGEKLLPVLKKLYKKRLPIYRSISTMKVDTRNPNDIESLTQLIVGDFNHYDTH
jgi:shikimate kinase